MSRWVGWAARAEGAVEERLAAALRGRPGWHVVVQPYVAHGTSTSCLVRGRVLLRRGRHGSGVLGPVLTAAARYASLDLVDVPVGIEVAGRSHVAVSGPEGYLETTVELPDVPAGWHDVTYRPTGGEPVDGPLLVVDPLARVGVVSDLDDTVIHTGLTRPMVAMRNTLLVADTARVAVAGGAALYQGLVAADRGRAPVFYVSTGAWNTHRMLMTFLDRTGYPRGPIMLTDWGPGQRWLFREDSAAFKARTILRLLAEHPHLSWVLVGDSGQHDAQAYAAVAREQPQRLRAIYIRDVPPTSLLRTSQVTELAEEVGRLGVPMLLVRDSAAAAEHAHGLGLVDAETVERVRTATETKGGAGQ